MIVSHRKALRPAMAWAMSLLLGVGIAAASPAGAKPKAADNGFDLSKATVPKSEILGGGPPRDGIRAVETPRFAPAAEADWVVDENPVLAVTVGGVTRVYPVHIMEYHQIVNDRFGDRAVAVTYDPLAGVPRAFEATHDGTPLVFRVSGLIRNHGFVIYDVGTESLWQQLDGQAISGSLAGTRLRPLRIRQEPLGSIVKRHPKAVVLAPPSPERHDYARSPFVRYWQTNKPAFPLAVEDNRFHLKEMVLGLRKGDAARVYLGSLATAADGEIDDEFAGSPVEIRYDHETATFRYDVPEGIEVIEAYWLAWKAWFPDAEIWSDPGPIPDRPRDDR